MESSTVSCVESTLENIEVGEFIKNLETDILIEKKSVEQMVNEWNSRILYLIGISECWVNSALATHLRNLHQMVAYIYTDFLINHKDKQEDLLQLLNDVEMVLGKNACQKTVRDVGAKVFHFMVLLIESGKNHFQSNGCTCVVTGCEEKAINSHSISRSHNFKRGVNYYSIKARIRDEKKANMGIYLGRVISSNASTRPMFCATHDRDLFQPIEGDSTLDVSNPEHIFLQNWRTFLWERHSTRHYIQGLRHELEKNPQLLNQRILQILEDKSNSDVKMFDAKNHDIVYFALSFTNKPPIIASFCEDLSIFNVDEKNSSVKNEQKFFFHLLNNKNNHCLVISGFRSEAMIKALTLVKDAYENDNYLFWQRIFNLMPLNKNVYVNESFAMNDALTDKMKKIYLNSHQGKGNSFMSPAPVSFSKNELFSFFGMSKLHTNI